MNPSAERKTQLKFRYQIQYTNEIYDHDYFQPRSQLGGTSSKPKRYHPFGMSEEKDENEEWKDKNQKKIGCKDQPIISVPNPNSEENNAVKMEEQQLSIQKGQEEKDHSKMPNKHSTPKKGKKNVNICLTTTAQKDGKGSQEEEVKTKSSRKGLAWISSHILELLEGEFKSDNRFTCGQISDKVLTDFYSTPKQKIEDGLIEEKQKKTIRRRVYDSINVLIALGKIKKWQKYLFVQSIDRKIGEEIVVVKKEKLTKCKVDLEKKEEMLNRAKAQYNKLLQLKARNEQLSQSKEQGYSGTFSTFLPGHNLYRFPLLLAYGEPNSKMRIQVNKADGTAQNQKDQIIISSEPSIYLLSDLSCLEYLNFHSQNSGVLNKKDKEKLKK